MSTSEPLGPTHFPREPFVMTIPTRPSTPLNV